MTANYTPPSGVRAAAKQALQMIEDGHAGGGFTAVGRGRAGDLAAGKSVSLETIKRMHSYFARHGVDKQGKGWSKGDPGYPSPGRVAWQAWGGDAGKTWTGGIVDKVNKGYRREELRVSTLNKAWSEEARKKAAATRKRKAKAAPAKKAPAKKKAAAAKRTHAVRDLDAPGMRAKYIADQRAMRADPKNLDLRAEFERKWDMEVKPWGDEIGVDPGIRRIDPVQLEIRREREERLRESYRRNRPSADFRADKSSADKEAARIAEIRDKARKDQGLPTLSKTWSEEARKKAAATRKRKKAADQRAKKAAYLKRREAAWKGKQTRAKKEQQRRQGASQQYWITGGGSMD